MSPWPAPERHDWHPARGILSPRDLQRALQAHPAWRLRGQRLTRTLRCKEHAEALGWVNRIAAEVDHFGRRPDLAISGSSRVLVSVSNPNHAGVTTAEIALIDQVDRVVERHRRHDRAQARSEPPLGAHALRLPSSPGPPDLALA
jgi:pterin-4a-carbinolamine dehydratase